MRASQILRSSGGDPKPGVYSGPFGSYVATMPQKGIVSYGLAPNRQRAMAGAGRAAIFNTFRRTRNQILYWGIPMLIGYEVMEWAIERNEYLNSKAGRAEFGDE